ncbi:MAG: hypothetical protein V2I43_09900 [Parvularcula sp.]|nr:hypothetical protein [Parvularcula sp.]
MLFDLDSSQTQLVRRPRAEVIAQIGDGSAALVLEHGFDLHPHPGQLSEKQKQRRDKLMRLIGPLLEEAPEIFDDAVRGSAVARIERQRQAARTKEEKERFATAKTIHKALDHYWRRGMTLNALTPRFASCGKGKRNPGEKKLGRPRLEGVAPGVNVTKEIEEIFEKGLSRYYASRPAARRKISLKDAYRLMVRDFFQEPFSDRDTGRTLYRVKTQWAETGYPSMRQFRYWYNRREDLLTIRRRRVGGSRYDKDMRGILGTAVAGLMGAGSRFEIDSTPIDINCVSEINRRIPVGRPTFYQVTDVLTKLICGVYVGFENASWLAANLAVRNVVENKVEFCAKYGISIRPEEWPCQGLMPARFMCDRGEWEGYDATGFVAKSGVTVELAAPYRGDQKGSGEKKFDMFHRLLRTELDGMVQKKHRERGDPKYEREAILTLREVTSAVIQVVLHLNNFNKLVDYPRSREMIADDIRAIPRDMWNWSVERGMVELSRTSWSHIEFSMLPVCKASTTSKGYKFRDHYYQPIDLRHQSRFDRARQGSSKKVTVSYDPLCNSRLWLHSDEEACGFVLLELTSRSEGTANTSFQEARAIKQDDAVHTQRHQATQDASFAAMTSNLKRTNGAARSQRKGNLTSADMQGQKSNREVERVLERQRRHGVGNDQEAASNVVPIINSRPRDDYFDADAAFFNRD